MFKMPRKNVGKRINKAGTENGAGTSTSSILWSIGENISIILPFIVFFYCLLCVQLNSVHYFNINAEFVFFLFKFQRAENIVE